MGRRSERPILTAVAPDGKTVPVPKTLQGLIRATSAAKSPIRTAISRMAGGQRAAFDLLRMAAREDETAKALVTSYDRLRGNVVGATLIEQVLDDCDVAPSDLIALIAKWSYTYNVAIGNGIAMSHYPKIMKASVDVAQTEKGVKDREMHLQHSGFAPSHKGIMIGINNKNGGGDDEAPPPGRPQSFDRTARTVVRELKP